MSEQLEIIRSSYGNKLEEIGNKQYVFVMYEITAKPNSKLKQWFLVPVVNLMASLVQNIGTTMLTKSGEKLAKYLYPRFLRPQMLQFPLSDVLTFAQDLTEIGKTEDPQVLALESVIEDQVKLLNPHKSLKDITPFLHTLGDLILQDPPFPTAS